MNTNLPSDLEAFVRSEVAAGRYADAADVIRDAVRRLAEARERLDATQIEALREAIGRGVADADAQNFVDGSVLDAARRAASSK